MRLAILTFDFPPTIGGVQLYLYEIARRLGTAHDVIVITPETGELPQATPLRRIRPGANHAFAYARALRRIRPDVVLVGHTHPQLLLAARMVSPRYGAIAYGNDFLAGQRRWHRPLFNAMLRRARPLVTITQANAQRLQGLGIPGASVVHPGADPQRFTPPDAIPTTAPILLTVARLVARKGIDTVLAALPALVQRWPDLQYHIAGAGPDHQRLANLVSALNMQAHVQFLGHVADADLPDLYRRSTLFVMPAREIREDASIEGFGIVYLEASAAGLPVVAGDSGGAGEAVRPGETGYLVPPDDSARLTETLAGLLADPALRRRLGQAGRRWVEDKMNWDRAAAAMQDLLAP